MSNKLAIYMFNQVSYRENELTILYVENDKRYNKGVELSTQ